MAKKREVMQRRRQLARTRRGLSEPERPKPGKPPGAAKVEERSQMRDLWIAVGIVVLIVAVFVAVYYFTVRKPPKAPVSPTITVIAPTPLSPAASPVAGVAPTGAPAAATPQARAKSWQQPPAMAIDKSKSYEAILKTDKGDIRIALQADKVPVTVNNFVFLARQGYYDGVTFHRVIPGFMAQTGDPTGTGGGGPGYTFADEFNSALRHDGEGIVSMANAGANTNGSQFFITYAPQPHLDNVHSVFGKVVSGMDVLKALAPRDPSKATTPGDRIISVEIVEK